MNRHIYTFWQNVSRACAQYPEYHYGQAFFNVLHELRPDLAEKIRGTEIDPFNSHTSTEPEVAQAAQFVMENW